MSRGERVGSSRCAQCGRALLIPLLRDVSARQAEGSSRLLVRCAYCRERTIVRDGAGSLTGRHAAALRFVMRGHSAAAQPWPSTINGAAPATFDEAANDLTTA